ncbi:MAG TPA: hypothetical protein GXZ95_00065 [Mollicutes bacterium]|nr:hypothetical protein [Mollicutes bacterium]
MIKRASILILFLLLISFIAIDSDIQVVEEKPQAYEVIKYMNTDFYTQPEEVTDFYLLFDTFKLDSNNFVKILSFFNNHEYKIIEIYPYINPMYESILKDVSVIKYNGNTLKEGILKAYNIYLKKLENNYLSEEIDKVLVNGMRIRMIKINVRNNVLSLFLRRYPTVKFSKYSYGLFKTLDV